jgi:putative nucleotidyltransferase with HDIG domain
LRLLDFHFETEAFTLENNGLVNGLVRILNKDLDTYKHSRRVGKLAKGMANSLNLDIHQKRKLLIGCTLHDVGKVMIPDEILKKPSRLSESEFEIMKRHPTLGHNILLIEGIADPDVMDIVRYHHERWDGLGYPYGMKGKEIPFYARICAIIDAFDCMVTDRPYRKGISLEGVKRELITHSGSQFDPYYINKFIHLLDTDLFDEYCEYNIRGHKKVLID